MSQSRIRLLSKLLHDCLTSCQISRAPRGTVGLGMCRAYGCRPQLSGCEDWPLCSIEKRRRTRRRRRTTRRKWGFVCLAVRELFLCFHLSSPSTKSQTDFWSEHSLATSEILSTQTSTLSPTPLNSQQPDPTHLRLDRGLQSVSRLPSMASARSSRKNCRSTSKTGLGL